MKCYTIIDQFEADGRQTWVANYSSKEDAIKCLREMLAYDNMLDKDDRVINGDDPWPTVEELFDDLLANGYGYEYCNGGDRGFLFVRGEEIQDKFDPEQMPFF